MRVAIRAIRDFPRPAPALFVLQGSFLRHPTFPIRCAWKERFEAPCHRAFSSLGGGACRIVGLDTFSAMLFPLFWPQSLGQAAVGGSDFACASTRSTSKTRRVEDGEAR